MKRLIISMGILILLFIQALQAQEAYSMYTFLDNWMRKDNGASLRDNPGYVEFLRLLTPEELGYVRNAIFAKKGHIFEKEKYKHFFEFCIWAQPCQREKPLTANDSANLALVASFTSAYQDRFQAFLSRFDKARFPVEVDANSSYSDRDTLNDTDVCTFLYSDEAPEDRHSRFLNCSFGVNFPLFTFSTDSFVGICYVSMWGAGGGLDRYELLTFSRDGRKLCGQLIGCWQREVDYKETSHAMIDEHLQIREVERHVEYDLDDNMNPRDSSTTTKANTYHVTPSGRIE